jgi:hypothetical protein
MDQFHRSGQGYRGGNVSAASPGDEQTGQWADALASREQQLLRGGIEWCRTAPTCARKLGFELWQGLREQGMDLTHVLDCVARRGVGLGRVLQSLKGCSRDHLRPPGSAVSAAALHWFQKLLKLWGLPALGSMVLP